MLKIEQSDRLSAILLNKIHPMGPKAKPAAPKRAPVPAPAPKKRPVRKKKVEVKKPETIKQYLLDSLESIGKFFQFVFASDMKPREQELLDASVTFVHYV